MVALKRQVIDWKKTGKRLKALRDHDVDLRRYTCWFLQRKKGECTGDCTACEYEMDQNISRAELAAVFLTSENVIANWESGKTPVPYEDLLFYCRLTGESIHDIVVFF